MIMSLLKWATNYEWFYNAELAIILSRHNHDSRKCHTQDAGQGLLS